MTWQLPGEGSAFHQPPSSPHHQPHHHQPSSPGGPVRKSETHLLPEQDHWGTFQRAPRPLGSLAAARQGAVCARVSGYVTYCHPSPSAYPAAPTARVLAAAMAEGAAPATLQQHHHRPGILHPPLPHHPCLDLDPCPDLHPESSPPLDLDFPDLHLESSPPLDLDLHPACWRGGGYPGAVLAVHGTRCGTQAQAAAALHGTRCGTQAQDAAARFRSPGEAGRGCCCRGGPGCYCQLRREPAAWAQ